jgi:hypothetical protein
MLSNDGIGLYKILFCGAFQAFSIHANKCVPALLLYFRKPFFFVILIELNRCHMIHDLRKRGVNDASRIDVHDDLDVKDWATKFQVTPKILYEAIAEVGPGICNVREYLHRKGFIVAS